ncbi:MAG: TIM-barrel domain-containing protein [bacterium]
MHIFPLSSFAGLLVLLCAACGGASSPDQIVVEAFPLRMRAEAAPWQMTFEIAEAASLRQQTGLGTGPTGTLGLHIGPPAAGSGSLPALPQLVAGVPAAPPQRDSGWAHATEILDSTFEGEAWVAILATTEAGREIELRVTPQGEGILSVVARARNPEGVQAVGIAFEAEEGEHFIGFGERGNAVDQRGQILEHYVGEGPYQDDDYAFITAVVPKWGVRWRPDATYFPMPWLLSSRGYGVLLDNDELSYHRILSEDSGAWSMEVEASEMRFRVFAGTTPAEALRRFSAALGRQPHNYAPWFFGPWVQPDTSARIDELHDADVPTSVTATYLHFLPCGSQQGREESEPERVASLNAKGTAVHTYFNPMVCVDYTKAYNDAASRLALIRNQAGQTYDYSYFTSRPFVVSQYDFTSENGAAAYALLTDEALSYGYEGWMEDFGEYTPLDAVSADGATGTRFHNRYPRDYHCGVAAATADIDKPLARFARSGWTGSAACSPIVWGGDPTTNFGFDGLESSIYQALSIGASGVGIWGSDIGGFFATGPFALTDELLDRWIAFGALSPIMRSQKDGIAIPVKDRAHLWDPGHLAIWRRYAKLHTQLYPYLQAAAEEYFATGMPIMRHHLLSDPEDPAAMARDDQYRFGPDLLVAPVYRDGAREREVYLPVGDWVDWWRSIYFDEASGGFTLGELSLLEGGQVVTVDAPIDEIPLMVRTGTVLPLLAPDVFTLAEHGSDPAIIHLSDRADQLHLLAFPRGESSGRLFASESWTSRETENGWSLRIEGETERLIHLQGFLDTLDAPIRPCRVTLDGADLAEGSWSWDTDRRVLDVRYRTRAGELLVGGC